MTKEDAIFSEEYISKQKETASTVQEVDNKDPALPEQGEPEKVYAPSKPKRVIIRAIVSHDKD
ncbi:hypothetical protein [Desulfocurvibacter africanus]|uniref:hypothetical protein n=1 Tax=Desulfocurvibacter africanus TaxID=873 RepID=UPI0012686960|nr:hypothetical protein [Desulfocurvibacter africanus]